MSGRTRGGILFTMVAMVALVGAGCVPAAPQGPASAPPNPSPTAAPRRLDLHGKGLTKVPADVFNRTDLEELDLSDNALIDSLPSELGRLTKLKVLDVSGNRMTGLPAEVGRLHDLEILDVSGNRLAGLPLEIGGLSKLRVFDVSGNPYSAQDLDRIITGLPKTAEVRR